jgi:acetyl-CoA carboxylase biotin carboxyl carrier protein
MPVHFDAEAVRTLAAILTETGLTEIEIEAKEGRIRVARTPAPVAASLPVASAMPVAAPGAIATLPAAVAAEAATGEDPARHPGAVLSPMVGIAYLSAEPGAAPFVTAGQAVTAGQTLLLIEAMKTFNQIKAPKAGTVSRILVASGAPVEYGEPLLIIE